MVEKAFLPPPQPVDLGAKTAGLRAVLTDALDGISFLIDQVTRLHDENDQLHQFGCRESTASGSKVRR